MDGFGDLDGQHGLSDREHEDFERLSDFEEDLERELLISLESGSSGSWVSNFWQLQYFSKVTAEAPATFRLSFCPFKEILGLVRSLLEFRAHCGVRPAAPYGSHDATGVASG
jgi:hypothetical protein